MSNHFQGHPLFLKKFTPLFNEKLGYYEGVNLIEYCNRRDFFVLHCLTNMYS
jgi:hypothetical protein